jgi:mannose/cellobiose epimerase-like protein (N-acyl-D-glucosamine 2-epimerase family)|nr:AGE family epimerase/isomerase [Neorhizobium tomejilense]
MEIADPRPEFVVGKLLEQRVYLRKWLYKYALPLWWSAGADKVNGGFHELLDLNGDPVPSDRRFRVQPRQVYCYAAAGLASWSGPWREAADHGIQYFESRYRLDAGHFAALASADGVVIDRQFDLYNQAFALLAYAQGSLSSPEVSLEYEEKALGLLASLEPWRHPQAGFEEGIPRKLPLCSNPHMHMLEAALAWEAASQTKNPIWTALADEIVQLCLTFLIDTQTGVLREFFDGDWRPYPDYRGRITEPGHQFEWAWLLVKWGQARHDGKAIEAARRLFELAVAHGICDRRQMAVMQLSDDFSILDESCRLWPQTEWIKAALALATNSDEAEKCRFWGEALRGITSLRRFLDEVPRKGLWRDRMMSDGRWQDEAAPASTFYHIVCAILELDNALEGLHVAENYRF